MNYEQLQEYLVSNQRVWLITGVAGFIGSNLLEKLLTLNQKVVGLDNFDTGYQHNIDQAIKDASNISGRDVERNFHFIRGDIREFNDCEKACHGVDYVLNQAALGSVPRSIEDPLSTNKTNIDGFLNILLCAQRAGVNRVVYAASSSTYGDSETLPKVEDVIGKPLSPYAVTKLVNEIYAEVFHRVYSLDSIGLRYFNVFGKRQDPLGSYAAVIPKWIDAIRNERECYIYGDGLTSRDFCFIDSVVQANILAATTQKKEAFNQIYNIAYGESHSLIDLHKEICDIVSSNNKDLVIREPIYQDFRDGDVRHSLADISKAKKLLGYRPTTNLSSGLKKTIEETLQIL